MSTRSASRFARLGSSSRGGRWLAGGLAGGLAAGLALLATAGWGEAPSGKDVAAPRQQAVFASHLIPAEERCESTAGCCGVACCSEDSADDGRCREAVDLATTGTDVPSFRLSREALWAEFLPAQFQPVQSPTQQEAAEEDEDDLPDFGAPPPKKKKPKPKPADGEEEGNEGESDPPPKKSKPKAKPAEEDEEPAEDEPAPKKKSKPKAKPAEEDEPADEEPAPKKKKPKAKPAEEEPSDEPAPKKKPDKPKSKSKSKSAKAGKLPTYDLPGDVCKTCCGTGTIPLRPRVPYVHVEGQGKPSARQAVPWQHCPTCAGDSDPQELVDAEEERLATYMDSNKEWEKRTKWNLMRVEGRHGAAHCENFQPDTVVKIGQAMEAAAQYIQTQSGTTFLTPARPNKNEILYAWDEARYAKLIELCQSIGQFKGIQDWELISKSGGFRGEVTRITQHHKGKGVPPENVAISEVASHCIDVAARGRGRDWLGCGFPYHCEYAVSNKVLIHFIRYRQNETKFGNDWISETRKKLAEKKLIAWEDLINKDLADWEAPDHLNAFATVTYLFKTDPKKFVKLIYLLGQEKTDVEAIETAYGKKLPDLQQLCFRWIMTGA